MVPPGGPRPTMITRALSRVGYREWLFWAALAVWALLPGSRSGYVRIGSIPVTVKDLTVVVLAAVLLLAWRDRRAAGPPWHAYLPWLLVAVLGYMLLSLWWTTVPARDRAGMAVMELLTLAAFTIAYVLVAPMRGRELRDFLWRVTLVLTAIATLYTAQSFLDLGLRAAQPLDFGIERVRGPLFAASTGYFVLLPAFGLAIARLIASPRAQRPVAALVAGLLSASILGSGSRGAVVALATFAVVALLMVRSGRQGLALAVLIGLIALGATLIFSRATPDRVLDFEDAGRSETHATALAHVANRSVATSLRGSGLGSVWPWYLIDLEGGGPRRTGRYTLPTLHGRVFFHPHSVLLFVGVELGVVGILFLGGFLAIPIARLWRHSSDTYITTFGAAVLASTVALFFDLLLFKSFQLSAVWWVYLLGFLRLTRRRTRRARAGPPSDQRTAAAVGTTAS